MESSSEGHLGVWNLGSGGVSLIPKTLNRCSGDVGHLEILGVLGIRSGCVEGLCQNGDAVRQVSSAETASTTPPRCLVLMQVL